jgi:hypothetical protein
MAKKRCYDKMLVNLIFHGKEDEDKRRQENGLTLIYLSFTSKLLFLDIH